jgi:hypothetical protein
VTQVARYRTSDGELQQDLASLRGAPALFGCSMALDPSGQFLLIPYSLKPARPDSMLKVAEISTTTGAVMTLTIQLPYGAGMAPPTGMNTAW